MPNTPQRDPAEDRPNQPNEGDGNDNPNPGRDTSPQEPSVQENQ